MKKVLEKLKEIETGDFGIIIFSQEKQKIIGSLNKELIVPLASAGKVVIAFCIAKLVEEGRYRWDDLVDNVSFNPK